MCNLLSANLSRLLRNKLFWLSVLVMMALSAYITIGQHIDGIRYHTEYPITEALFMSATVLGIAAAAFVSLFVGVEYSDGTIRNKLIVGRVRRTIYLSGYLVNALGTVVIYIFSILTALALGLPLLEPSQVPPAVIAGAFGVGVLMSACYGAIFHFVSMLLSNRAYSAVVCILLSFLLLIGAVFVNGKLDQPEYIEQLVNTESVDEDVDVTVVPVVVEDGVVQPMAMETVPNPNYLTGAKRERYQFFYEVNPTGQVVQLAQIEFLHPGRMAVYDLILILLFNVGGILLFERKDIK